MGMGDLYIIHEEGCDECIHRNIIIDELNTFINKCKEEENKRIKEERTIILDNECSTCKMVKRLIEDLQSENTSCAESSFQSCPDRDD